METSSSQVPADALAWSFVALVFFIQPAESPLLHPLLEDMGTVIREEQLGNLREGPAQRVRLQIEHPN